MNNDLWREVPPTHVQVAGIAVRDKVIADLALLLHRRGKSRLAAYVGRAWDRCRPELPLNNRDITDIVTALEPVRSADLQPLYEALLDRIGQSTRSKPPSENELYQVTPATQPRAAAS